MARIDFFESPLLTTVAELHFWILFDGTYARTGIDEKECIATSMIALSIVLAGYFIIYLITPRDLGWHLAIAESPHFAVVPKLLVTYFLIVRTPEEVLMRKETQLAASALN
jgi:hypothetical protein